MSKINEFVSQTWRHWYSYRWHWEQSTIVIRGMWALLGLVRLVLHLLGTAGRWRSICDKFPEYVTITRTDWKPEPGRRSSRSSFLSLMFRVHISAQSLSVVAKPLRGIPLSLHANPGLEHQNILRPLPSMFVAFRHYADRLIDSVVKETLVICEQTNRKESLVWKCGLPIDSVPLRLYSWCLC